MDEIRDILVKPVDQIEDVSYHDYSICLRQEDERLTSKEYPAYVSENGDYELGTHDYHISSYLIIVC